MKSRVWLCLVALVGLGLLAPALEAATLRMVVVQASDTEAYLKTMGLFIRSRDSGALDYSASAGSGLLDGAGVREARVVSTTAARINTPPASSQAESGSPRNTEPRNTATIGFTYA